MHIGRCFSPGGAVSAPVLLGVLGLLIAGTALAASPARPTQLLVTSTTFHSGGPLPAEAAYAGCAAGARNRAPELQWSRGPIGTKAYAITLTDSDASTGHGFYHWLLVGIPPGMRIMPAGGRTPSGARALRNDFGAAQYGGPCPPPGDKPHRYIFTVRALDVARPTGLAAVQGGAAVEAVLRQHTLASGTLVGHFGR
jgi:Raf kinase inhibitor-like YbhB/YbcL family protein